VPCSAILWAKIADVHSPVAGDGVTDCRAVRSSITSRSTDEMIFRPAPPGGTPGGVCAARQLPGEVVEMGNLAVPLLALPFPLLITHDRPQAFTPYQKLGVGTSSPLFQLARGK
jgi:hypothetical protein